MVEKLSRMGALSGAQSMQIVLI